MSTTIDQMQAFVKEAAEPACVGDSVKAAIRRAARRLGLPYGRVKRLWYGEARMVSADEYLATKQKIVDRRKARAESLRRELETLDREIAQHERDRENFQRTHPFLARLAPPAIPPLEGRKGRAKKSVSED